MEGVAREIVIAVLRAYKVGVSETVVDGRVRHTLIKGDVVEAHFLPDCVPRHLVGRFGVKFDIPQEHFWHPDMLPEQLGLHPGTRPH